MSDKQNFRDKDISKSEFRSVNMTGCIFEDVDLSGAKFFNINLRGADIGAVDFGGASFSCMNTGECHPKKPAAFKNIELHDCTMQRCHFRNTKLVDCDVTGMTIDGVPVTDMIKAYQEINSISNELPALEGEKLTKPELSGKRFAFLYIEDNRGEEQNGVLRLDSDGTIAEYDNPNEAEWEVDEAGRLLVRSKEGIVSTVFNKVSIIDDKYELSGPFMLYGEITHILREL